MTRVLGIDLGKARTGLAISDELKMLAHPLETVEAGEAIERILEIVREKEIEEVVVGLPRHMNGSLGVAATEAQQFAKKLQQVAGCKVTMWDERLSTVAAERALREAGKKSRQTRGIRDQVAAQIILQSYLDRLNG